MCCGCRPGVPCTRGMGVAGLAARVRYKIPCCRKCLILLRKSSIVVNRS